MPANFGRLTLDSAARAPGGGRSFSRASPLLQWCWPGELIRRHDYSFDAASSPPHCLPEANFEHVPDVHGVPFA